MGQRRDTKRLVNNQEWSAENPYAYDATHTKNKHNRQSLYNSAMAWEEEFGNWNRANEREDELLDRQRQLELEDRQHAEDYNDPAAQAARMRAAGLNPDLQQVSGGASLDPQNDAGSASVQAGAGLETPQPLRGTEIANTVFNGVNALANLATAGFNIFAGAKKLPYETSQMSAASRLTNAQAQLVERTTDPQVRLMNAQSYLTEQNAGAAATNNIMSDYRNIADVTRLVASQVDENGEPVPVTEDAVLKTLDDIGYSTASGKDPKQLIKNLLSSSVLRDFVAQNAYDAKLSRALNECNTFANISTWAQNVAGTHLMMSYKELNDATIKKEFSDILASTDAYANDLANAELSRASTEAGLQSTLAASDYGAEVARYKYEKLRAYSKNWSVFLDDINKNIQRCDSQLSKLCPSGNPLTLSEKDLIDYNAIQQARAYYVMCGCDFGNQLCDMYNQANYLQTTASSLNTQNANLLQTDVKFGRRRQQIAVYWSPYMSGETFWQELGKEGAKAFFENDDDEVSSNSSTRQENMNIMTSVAGAAVKRGM